MGGCHGTNQPKGILTSDTLLFCWGMNISPKKRVMQMYRIGTQYKIERKDGIFFTGVVLEEDAIAIKMDTIRNEVVIINKEAIKSAKEMESNGDRNGKAK